ncbi:hypothetical protein H671_5g14394 [Cricetulus griseus]|nr:hypothetical protein H671_5g14394 [Cricetulus griseus]
MSRGHPGSQAQLDVSSRSMLPIEEPNLASVPSPNCRAPRSRMAWDQRAGRAPGPKRFSTCLPHSGLQPLYGLVNEPDWGPPFMLTCPTPARTLSTILKRYG